MKNETAAAQPQSETSALHPPRSSRHRYLKFVADYKQRRLDDLGEPDKDETPSDDKATERKPAQGLEALGLQRGKRREYLREYLVWLWPHRYAVGVLFTLALLVAAMEMAEPLF